MTYVGAEPSSNHSYSEEHETGLVPIAVIVLAVVAVFVALSVGSFFLSGRIYHFIEQDFASHSRPINGIKVAGLAVILGCLVWYLRDFLKLKIVPFLEMALGATFSIQGVVVPSRDTETIVIVGVIGFVGGARIIVDAFKRAYEYDAWNMMQPRWFVVNWKLFKEFCGCD
jgi:hypothetical protein